MRWIALMAREDRDLAVAAAHEMGKLLTTAGIKTFDPRSEKAPSKCRMVITFGGDGTLLAGTKYALKYDCPLLGIHMGTVGFLTEGSPIQMQKIADIVINETWELEPRRLLQVRIDGRAEEWLALNDAVVTRGGFARLIQVETRVNMEHWGTFIADGVIAATPTGSTGYSLSAGGPVVAPGVECMVITPVCAHSLQHCPCVVPREAEIRFHLRAEREQRAELQIDGQSMSDLQAGDTVIITGAERVLWLVRVDKYHFFQLLQTKLNEWMKPGEEGNS